MRSEWHTRFRLVAGALCILVLANCNPDSRRRVLSTFFDGVPPAAADSIMAAGIIPADSNMAVAAVTSPQPVVTVRNLHAPFRERSCTGCHERAFSNSLKTPTPQLCYGCHEDFRQEFAFLHGPVAGGYCTQCHNPHQSSNPKLLVMKEDQLCFHCHQPADVYQNEEHEEIEPSECLDCHNPHGGQDWSFTE